MKRKFKGNAFHNDGPLTEKDLENNDVLAKGTCNIF